MAAPTPRFVNMAPNNQVQLVRRFLSWVFTLPGNHGVRTGGWGQGQRAIAAGAWRPITSPNGVMATGAEGIVHLWCRVDPHTLVIQDRVVVKEVVSGSARYLDPNNWDNNIVGSEPLECHQANVVWVATSVADRQHIEACLGWGGVKPTHTPQTYRYKLYHEYCAHKNLHRVMKNQPRKKRPGAVRRGRRQFPEPFLWYMFESLAKACVGMDGAYNGRGVVHQDLHPGNVFFDTPNQQRFPLYPVLKVADFGSAREITPAVTNRGPIMQGDPVCLTFATPEHAWNDAAWAPNAVQLWEAPNMTITQRTNIYQVGLIMASAMRLMNPLPEDDWREPPPNYRVPQANQLHHDGAHAPLVGVHELTQAQLNPGPRRYSQRLVRLVWRCLRHNDNLRPTAAQLLLWIQNWANFQGMDTATAATMTDAQRRLRVDLDPEQYSVGSVF